jgi:PPP family 3-phenylpropionic acid transporter
VQAKLSAFWFLYLGGWGIFFPYYGLYLGQSLALSASEVGLVMAAIPLAGLFAQPLWGQVADRTGSRRRVLALLAACTALTTVALALPRDFASAILATAVFAVFSTSVLPMTNAVTLAGVGRDDIGRFGPIRMWGTIGFLLMVIVFPHFLDAVADIPPPFEAPGELVWMFPGTALFLAAAAILALFLPDKEAFRLRSERGDVRRLIAHPPVFRLLVLSFLAHLFFQGPINLFPLFVADRGGDAATLGRMWIFMLLLEIPLVGFSGATLRRLGARGLLRMGLLAEGLRWTVCAFSESLTTITVMQLLHGIGVAGLLMGAPLYLEQAIPERLRSTGQALVATVSFGAGAIVSNVAFGFLMERFGTGVPYAVAGAGAFVLAVVVRRILPLPSPPA